MVRGVLLLTGATGRVGAELLPHAGRARRAGALPGARPATSRIRPRAGAARARRPRRSRLVPPRAARRAAPSSTSPRRGATSPRRGSRSSTASRSLRLVAGGRARRRRALRCSSRRSAPRPLHPLRALPRQGARRGGRRRRPRCRPRSSRASAIHGRARAPPAAARRRRRRARAADRRRRRRRLRRSPRSTGPACTSSPARRPCAGATFARLAAGHRPLRVPPPLLRPALRGYETLAGPAALLTWDEARRATVAMTTPHGHARRGGARRRAAPAHGSVKPRISCAVSSGTSSCGQWPTPSSTDPVGVRAASPCGSARPSAATRAACRPCPRRSAPGSGSPPRRAASRPARACSISGSTPGHAAAPAHQVRRSGRAGGAPSAP